MNSAGYDIANSLYFHELLLCYCISIYLLVCLFRHDFKTMGQKGPQRIFRVRRKETTENQKGLNFHQH
jgi:hypothetical protein